MHNEQSPKFVSTIKTNSNIITMTAPAPDKENRDSNLSYAAINTTQDSHDRLHRNDSAENRAIYKNVCHVKSPSKEVKRTSSTSELGSKISFESDFDTKNLLQRSKSTKSVKGDAIKKAIAMLENSKQMLEKSSSAGLSVSRTPSNKLTDVENAKMQGE